MEHRLHYQFAYTAVCLDRHQLHHAAAILSRQSWAAAAVGIGQFTGRMTNNAGLGISDHFRQRPETSIDGVTWTADITRGSFDNIQNNPSLQEVAFAPVSARYFRFTSLQAVWNSGWTSATEISVLPVEQ